MLPAVTQLSKGFTKKEENNTKDGRLEQSNLTIGRPLRHNYCAMLQRDAESEATP